MGSLAQVLDSEDPEVVSASGQGLTSPLLSNGGNQTDWIFDDYLARCFWEMYGRDETYQEAGTP